MSILFPLPRKGGGVKRISHPRILRPTNCINFEIDFKLIDLLVSELWPFKISTFVSGFYGLRISFNHIFEHSSKTSAGISPNMPARGFPSYT